MKVPVLSARGIYIVSNTSVIVFTGWHFEIVSVVLAFREKLVGSIKYEVCFAEVVTL